MLFIIQKMVESHGMPDGTKLSPNNPKKIFLLEAVDCQFGVIILD